MSLDSRANRKLAEQEFSEGKTVLSSTPTMLTLETTSRCNLRCVMCPHAIGAVDRPKHLEEQLSQKLDNYLSQAQSIQLHGIGEPLNSPSFWNSLANLPPPEACESSINTNFTAVNDDQINRLVNSNLKIISISLDAATPETYKEIRGYDFNKVIENIEKFNAQKALTGNRFPLLYLNMTLMRTNIEEFVPLISLAEKLNADKVCVWHLDVAL